MCGAVVVSNICVHQHTWVCRHQHHTGARRREIRLELIEHTWSKTLGREYDCSWIEQSRRIENWLIRLGPQKSSKFWKQETRLQTHQQSGDFAGKYTGSSCDWNFTNLGVEWVLDSWTTLYFLRGRSFFESLNKIKELYNQRKVPIPRSLVPIFKKATIVHRKISVSNGSNWDK